MRTDDPDCPSSNSNALAPTVLIGQVGLAGALPIVIGVVAGAKFQERIGGTLGGLALVGGVFLGIAGAVIGVYRVVAPFLNDKPGSPGAGGSQ